jgi:hypothetical protein
MKILPIQVEDRWQHDAGAYKLCFIEIEITNPDTGKTEKGIATTYARYSKPDKRFASQGGYYDKDNNRVKVLRELPNGIPEQHITVHHSCVSQFIPEEEPWSAAIEVPIPKFGSPFYTGTEVGVFKWNELKVQNFKNS